MKEAACSCLVITSWIDDLRIEIRRRRATSAKAVSAVTNVLVVAGSDGGRQITRPFARVKRLWS